MEAGNMTIQLDLEDIERTSRVHHALSTPLRLRIIRLLCGNNYYVHEIAQHLSIPTSTAALNVRILEEAGLIATSQAPGTRGMAKVCLKMISDVNTSLNYDWLHSSTLQIAYSIPIGSFFDCDPGYMLCGLQGERGPIGPHNDPSCFYRPDRLEAQLLWIDQGYVEYRIPNDALRENNAIGMRISFEACSEVANYNPDWPSDIYVSINGIELGVWTCPGDFGGRRGLFSPENWPTASTQFGHLKTWSVDASGTALDGKPLSSVTIDQLNLHRGNFFSLRIGVHPDAKNVGGMNLFGARFGDHPQDITLQLDLIQKKRNPSGEE